MATHVLMSAPGVVPQRTDHVYVKTHPSDQILDGEFRASDYATSGAQYLSVMKGISVVVLCPASIQSRLIPKPVSRT